MAQTDTDGDTASSVEGFDNPYTVRAEDDDDDAPLVKQLVNPHDMQSGDVNVPDMKQPAAADLLDFDSPPPKVP